MDDMTAKEEFIFLFKAYLKQAEADVEKWTEHLERLEGKPEPVAQSPAAMAGYARVTQQQLADAGLNPFAAQLLSESIAKNEVTETIKFRYENLGITIEPLSA